MPVAVNHLGNPMAHPFLDLRLGCALAEELSGTYRGMNIALPPLAWTEFANLTTAKVWQTLLRWVKRIGLSRRQKRRRESKLRTRRRCERT